MAKPNCIESSLTAEQKELLNNIESELRKQAALCYIANGYENKTKSYIDACKFLGKKPSKNPDVSGAEILGYPSVTRFIEAIRADVAETTKTDAEYVLRRLREIDELDIIDIMRDDLSDFKALSEWPKSWRTSISGLDLQTIASRSDSDDLESFVKKIKWPDKVKNLEMIGRHVGVKAWDKEEQKESPQDIVINFVPAEKPSAD